MQHCYGSLEAIIVPCVSAAFLRRPHCASNFASTFLLRCSWLNENPFFLASFALMTYFSSSCLRMELESINNCVMSALMLAIVFVIFCSLSKRHFYGWETSPGSTKQRGESLRLHCVDWTTMDLGWLGFGRSNVLMRGAARKKACNGDKSQPVRSLPGVRKPRNFRQPRAVHFFIASPW